MLSTPIVKDLDIDKVYEPAEDTFLFLDMFEQLHEEQYFTNLNSDSTANFVLEIGSGSGLITTFIAQHNIIPRSYNLVSDINIVALRTTLNTFNDNTENTNCDALRCNLADSIRSNQINYLLFNPPYVPSEEIPSIPDADDISNTAWVDLALVGGNDGMLITNNLLNSLNNILAINGEAYILFCARNKHHQVVENFESEWTNFQVNCVIQRKCGWEELAIYRFKKMS